MPSVSPIDVPPAIKGLSFVSCVEMVCAKALPGGFERLLSTLEENVRRQILAPPGANEWVPLAYLERVIDGAFEHAYGRSLELAFEHGKDGIKRDVRGIYAMFVRALSPDFTLRRA